MISVHFDLDHKVLFKFRWTHKEFDFTIWQFFDLLVSIEEKLYSIIIRCYHINENRVFSGLESMEIVFRSYNINMTCWDGLDKPGGLDCWEFEFRGLGAGIDKVLRYILLVLSTDERILRFFERTLENFIDHIHFWVIM